MRIAIVARKIEQADSVKNALNDEDHPASNQEIPELLLRLQCLKSLFLANHRTPA